MNESRTIVVGGGLAGLTAAATLARGGHAVTVLEGAQHVGGRARSRNKDGFDINIGPHALYRAGGGLAVLRQQAAPARRRAQIASVSVRVAPSPEPRPAWTFPLVPGG